MNPYYNAMRITRVFRGKQDKNRAKGEKDLAGIPMDLKGSPRYLAEVDSVRQRTEKEAARIAESTIKELVPLFSDMRSAINAKSTKSEAPWLALRLLVLSKLEHLNVPRVRAFAERLDGDPVCMQYLQEIAAKHNIKVSFLTEEDMMHAVDVLESNISTFVGGYRGDPDHAPASVKILEPYFQAEEDLLHMETGTAAKTDALFWDKVIQIGTPDMVNDGGSNGLKSVQHYFKDLAGLKAYIAEETAGMNLAEKEKKIAEILADCPDRYGAAYRNSLGPNPSTEEIDINA